MRIGLVLFGHLRSFRSAHDSYKNFLNTLQKVANVDVFCHTWDIEESVTASWWKEHSAGDIPSANVNANEIEEKYNPTRYIIEPSRQFDDSGYNIKSTIPVAGILSMLHSQQQGFQLLEKYSSENNIKYDVVIKSRYDLLYEIAPGFEKTITECATNDVVYLPSSNAYELAGSFSDVFAIGKADIMRNYFSFCTSFDKAIQLYKDAGYSQFLPELCMSVYLKKIGLKLKELTDLRLHILRLNGEKFQINSIQYFSNNDPLCFVKEIIEKNRGLASAQTNIAIDLSTIIKKYTSWIDKEANELLLNEYVNFFNGNHIAAERIKRLAEKEKCSNVFTNAVFRNFFENALRAANYGPTKIFFIALTLYVYSRYGIFFFKVWKRSTFNKD